jgi:hypothetical protein
VRAAAKESLAALGASGLSAAITMLQSEDRFARDSAAEVVINATPGDDEDRLAGMYPEILAG